MTPLLEGVRVLELSTVVMGPFAGQILADLGAEVIKIEPLAGDLARETQLSSLPGMGAMYVNNNRNKKVIALDLKSAEGKAVGLRLAARSDVFLHNMRVQAIERLGFGHEALAALNPNLIYCSAIGFGQRGRYRDLPAFDDVIQSASGLAGLSTYQGMDPQFMPTIVADKVGALYMVYGVLAALVGRAKGRTGGLKVEMPMFEALVSFMLNEHLAGATFGDDGEMGYDRIFSPNRRPHRTRDGWLAVLPYTGDQWKRFLTEVGRDDILREPWFSNTAERAKRIDFLYGCIADALGTRTTADWIGALSKLDVPFSKVSTFDDLLTDPHLEDIGFFAPDGEYPSEIKRTLPQPVLFEGVEARADRAAPPLGADSQEILQMAEYSAGEIEALIASGVVRC